MLKLLFYICFLNFIKSQEICQVAEWSDWSICGDDNKQFRTRGVTFPGDDCPDLVDYRECFRKVDCVVGPWMNIGKCKKGYQNQTRTIVSEPRNDGKKCPKLYQKVYCSKKCKKMMSTMSDNYFIGKNEILSANILENDVGATKVELYMPTFHGQIELKKNGTFIYIPELDYCGSDRLVYTASVGKCFVNENVTIGITCE